MEIAVILLAACGGFILGMYLVTQISDWIDKNTKR
tara:strand:+ start:7403 stop:7507 length:105 start_codon:yes stop_codon:yes gene_type:complete